MIREGEEYGLCCVGGNERVNVEYVSANPTGPLHMGHCRGAVVGDSLARMLEAAGFRVTKEYYVNDAGAQVDTLARSLHLRYREALGEDIGDIPEGMYPGDYLKPVGVVLAADYGDELVEAPEEQWLPIFRKCAIKAMLDLIRYDLGAARHPSRHLLVRSRGAAVRRRRPRDARCFAARASFTKARWSGPRASIRSDEWEPVELTLFRSTQFGDDQDRPMKKSDGSWTYFGADTAYHWQKAQNADHLVNIWGADHAGTVKRVQSAVKALTDGRVDLDVKLVQMVRLFRGGEPVKMSKRAGDFVTLADVVSEVGKDVVRFMMLTQARRHAARFRLREGGRGVEGQSGLLRPVRPCADQLAEAQGRRGGRRPCERCRSVAARRRGAGAGEARGAISARARRRRAGARAAPDRLLPLRSRGRVPRAVEPRQRRSRTPLPR